MIWCSMNNYQHTVYVRWNNVLELHEYISTHQIQIILYQCWNECIISVHGEIVCFWNFWYPPENLWLLGSGADAHASKRGKLVILEAKKVWCAEQVALMFELLSWNVESWDEKLVMIQIDEMWDRIIQVSTISI